MDPSFRRDDEQKRNTLLRIITIPVS